MARAVRFTKPEREIIRDRLRDFIEGGPMKASWQRAAESVLAKLEESEHPKEKLHEYLTVREALGIFQGVLDRRLIVPPNGASLLFIQMQQRLKSLGLTREQCELAAMQAGKQWPRGSIKAQSILNQAESLLQNAEGSTFDDSDSSSGAADTFDVMTDL